MLFQWDEQKDRTNQAKHDGIDFATAALTFHDPYMVLNKDRVEEGEQRWHAIGRAARAVLLVVHVYRTAEENGKEGIIRIISARAANHGERSLYLQQAS